MTYTLQLAFEKKKSPMLGDHDMPIPTGHSGPIFLPTSPQHTSTPHQGWHRQRNVVTGFVAPCFANGKLFCRWRFPCNLLLEGGDLPARQRKCGRASLPAHCRHMGTSRCRACSPYIDQRQHLATNLTRTSPSATLIQGPLALFLQVPQLLGSNLKLEQESSS